MDYIASIGIVVNIMLNRQPIAFVYDYMSPSDQSLTKARLYINKLIDISSSIILTWILTKHVNIENCMCIGGGS